MAIAFAGNAVLFGCADVTIATKSSYIGMGGPAMIEGGGTAVAPTEVGPSDIQFANGVSIFWQKMKPTRGDDKKLLGFFKAV